MALCRLLFFRVFRDLGCSHMQLQLSFTAQPMLGAKSSWPEKKNIYISIKNIQAYCCSLRSTFRNKYIVVYIVYYWVTSLSFSMASVCAVRLMLDMVT